MDYAEILTRLQDASDQELSDALAAVGVAAAQYKGAPTSGESVKALTELAAAARQLTGEQAARVELATQQAATLAELATLTEPAAVETPAEVPAETVTEEPSAPAVTEEPSGAADTTTPEGGATVVASAGRRLGGTQTKVDGNSTLAVRPQVNVKTTALPHSGLETLSELTRGGIASGFADKFRQIKGGSQDGRFAMLRMESEYPEERHFSREASWDANVRKAEAVQLAASSVHAQQNALVAAGLCAPLEVLYDISVLGETDRPVRDALTRFGADRGGITFRAALDGVTQTGGIGVWTSDDDEASPLVPKTCIEIACPGILTAEVAATYLCMTFSNMSTRFDPEQMDAQIRAQQIAHARFAENRLLTQLTAGSKALYTTQLLGAARDILVTLDKVIAYYRNVHRLTEATALRAILPLWAKNLIRADITRQMVGDGLASLAVVDSVIEDWFRIRNFNPTWHLDGIDPADLTTPDPDVVTAAQFYTLAVAQGLVPGFPNTVQMHVYTEGSWLYLDGGTLDLGLVRDSTLNGENRFQTFSESFETIVNRGVEPLVIYMAVNPTGASAATISTVGTVD